MAKKSEKKVEKGNLLENRYVTMILIALVIVLAIKLQRKEDRPNYWVDNVYLESYDYNENNVTTKKAELYFNLLSDKPSEVKDSKSFLGTSSKNNTLDYNKILNFTCHNKVTNDVYHIEAFDKEEGLRVALSEGGITENSLSNEKSYNNHIIIENQKIIENVDNIDYCSFIGITK